MQQLKESRAPRKSRPKLQVIGAEATVPEAQPLVADVTEVLGTDYYLVDELLTKQEREIRDRVRRFCDREVVPIINDYWERGEFPFELVPKLPSWASPAGRSRATAARACHRSPWD